jgi:predicted dehydrogenase
MEDNAMVAQVGIAILGVCGWMGKCHSLGYRNAPLLFPENETIANILWIVDSDEKKLMAIKFAYPNARVTTDWREVLSDPEVDLVDICLPDNFHYAVARAALLAGKNVYCEKPFTSTAEEALELAELAEEKSLVTRVGHNFPKNPVHEITRELITNDEIGDLVLFRASMHVDVLADPNTPFMWRCDGDLAPTGVVGDVASHLFSFISFLIGPIRDLVAEVATTTAQRSVVDGFGYGIQAQKPTQNLLRDVTNSDMVNLLCNFEGGGRGVIDVSRVAAGRRFLQTYEIYGTKGAISFDYDEVNRLKFYSSKEDYNRQGYRAIDVGPERRNFAAFLPVANFGLGYNEFKAIEVCEVVHSVATGKSQWPTFRDGYEIMQVVEACSRSSDERAWVNVR